MSISSSSSRTVSGRNPQKRPMDLEADEPSINLNHLDIPDVASDHGFSVLEDESEGKHVDPVPLSPQTLAFRKKIIDDARAERIGEFRDKPNLGYTSVYTSRPISTDVVKSWISLGDRYRCVILLSSDKIWIMPEFGMHGIPSIHFEYGHRLLMHPFHLTLYEAVGCKIA